MADKLVIDRGRTAVLVMDYQEEIVGLAGSGRDDLLQRAAAVIAASRRAKLPVIYVVVRFRAGYPEISPNNAGFSGIKARSGLQEGTPGAAVHAAVAPLPSEAVVVKHRVNAFYGTDLEMILRAQGIETLVLLGIATSGVVVSTLRYAADADYRQIVIEDCCADANAELHQALVGSLFPRQATVVTAQEFLSAVAAE